MRSVLRATLCGIILVSGSFSITASACPECRASVQGGIYNQDFLANLFVILLPILVLTAIGVGFYYADELAERVKEGISKWLTKEDAAL